MQSLVEPWFRLGYVTPHPLVDNVQFGKPVLLNLNASLWAALHGARRGLPVADRGMLLGSSR